MTAPRAPRCLLAFDTSTQALAVGAWVQGRVQGLRLEGGPAASLNLLPAATALLQQCGATLQDLDAVAFGRGPGAFTGLRTSCAAAQGLAFGLGCAVLPLDSLLVVAEAAWQRPGRADGTPWDIGIAMDARMGEVYAARYERRPEGWATVEAPALLDPPALAARWRGAPPRRVAGSALAEFGAAALGLDHAGRCELLPDEPDRAPALLALALEAWQRGAALGAESALPLYLRDKVALTTQERDAARAAAR